MVDGMCDYVEPCCNINVKCRLNCSTAKVWLPSQTVSAQLQKHSICSTSHFCGIERCVGNWLAMTEDGRLPSSSLMAAPKLKYWESWILFFSLVCYPSTCQVWGHAKTKNYLLINVDPSGDYAINGEKQEERRSSILHLKMLSNIRSTRAAKSEASRRPCGSLLTSA